MSILDWVIVLVPLFIVMAVGYYIHHYVRSVADFVQARRLCGRYVICVGDVANALSIIGIITYD